MKMCGKDAVGQPLQAATHASGQRKIADKKAWPIRGAGRESQKSPTLVVGWKLEINQYE
jgi:hypothetical protein